MDSKRDGEARASAEGNARRSVRADCDDIPEDPDVADLLDELEALRRTVDDPEEREQLSRTVRMAHRIPGSATFGRTIDKYTSRDVAESFVGSILISLPMLVEDGVYAIGDHFASDPAFFVGNVAFVVPLTIGLLYWADLQRVSITNPIFGVIPHRLVGVLSVAFLTSAFTMTVWGRIDWVDPWVTLCSVPVVWSAARRGTGGHPAGRERGDRSLARRVPV